MTAWMNMQRRCSVAVEFGNPGRTTHGPGAHATGAGDRRTVSRIVWLAAACLVCWPTIFTSQLRADDANLIRSVGSGPWSQAATWEQGRVPPEGSRVQIREGHTVLYDLDSKTPIRLVHVAGTLRFAGDRNTRLDVGVLKIQPGTDASENGFDCEAHVPDLEPGQVRPALEVGTPAAPIDAEHTARIRLVYFEGMDKKTCPAIVACGGRMDFHGAPLNRTWLKLARTAAEGSTSVEVEEAVAGWRVGDRLLITATRGTRDTFGTRRPGDRDQEVYTEERTLRAIDGKVLTLDKPLEHEHLGEGDYRGEVANLSRNVMVESADAGGTRGHTLYHRNSAGAISYAEFRHLGKENVLGKYSLHFHLVGDTMRGSYVLGASIWDSHNRWITIHGTNYLVVRDCVGYQSVGHGYFLEDGTEVFNVLDRNLAVQAYVGRRLPEQVLPFDSNDGAGFWWANSLNTFTRNVACENDRYGFRFDAQKTSRFDPVLAIPQPDGSWKQQDIRTLPFVRCEANEAHCDGKYGFNLGEGVREVGPDVKHPFVIRDLKLWQVHYAFRPQSPSLLCEGLAIHEAGYGIYHPNYDHHVYRDALISRVGAEPFNRAHDDGSHQLGPLAVDGLTFAGHRNSGMPLIQISDHNPSGQAESHFRRVQVIDRQDQGRRALVNLGGGPRPKPKTEAGVPVYVHDYYGPGRHAKVVSTKTREYQKNSSQFREDPPLTGDESRAAEVRNVTFPELLEPVDDLPPATVITHMEQTRSGELRVRGTSSDNGDIQRVVVNGQPVRAVQANFAQWEIVLPTKAAAATTISAHAIDAAGNEEPRPHRRSL